MKLLGSTKKLKNKTKERENNPSLEAAKLVSVQCNLVDNQYQQKSEILYTFTPSKSYVYLLHVEPSNLVFLKTYNTEFDEIIITFADQNGWPLETEDKVNYLSREMTHPLSLAIRQYSIEPRPRKYVKGYRFFSFARNYKKILDTGLDSLKTASKKVVHKAGEFLRNKISYAVTKSNNDKIVKQEPVEEIIIPPEGRDEILNKLRQVLL